jgi:hypothetical protein
MDMQHSKQMIARSTVNYRGVTIIETESGCTFIVSGKPYDFAGLTEATACIDAMCAALSNILSSVALAE